jgi:prephenate dehydrogenase
VSRGVRRATVVGTGLIGGSVALALRANGWRVSGVDDDPARVERALDTGVIDAAGVDPESELSFVATPVGAVPAAARRLLDATPGAVTDVGSVKDAVVAAVGHPRFVGGHPMAGSEQEGLDGATPTMFTGAVWVLTPVAGTDDEAFAVTRSVVRDLGAEVVVIPPDRHDLLVAVVSHVPHLTAATLMRLASERAEEHQALLRLAAGGFRDMTRIAAGHPGIWPDICAENRAAITEVLDRLIVGLTEVRATVAAGDRERLLELLTAARSARVNLPGRFSRPDELSELRVPVLDRKGEIATICTLATDLGVSILDIEVAHSAEGDRGVLVLLVEKALSERLRGGLMANGYRPSLRALT